MSYNQKLVFTVKHILFTNGLGTVTHTTLTMMIEIAIVTGAPRSKATRSIGTNTTGTIAIDQAQFAGGTRRGKGLGAIIIRSVR